MSNACQFIELQKLSLQLWLTPAWGTGEFVANIHNRKPIYSCYRSTALLCYQNKHIFNRIYRVIAYYWWIYLVPLVLHWYKASFSTCWLFCGFKILVALDNKRGLVAVAYTGSLTQGNHAIMAISPKPANNMLSRGPRDADWSTPDFLSWAEGQQWF